MDTGDQTQEYFSGGFNGLADVVGIHAARLLCHRFGGLERVYIPVGGERENPIRDMIGDAKFNRLTETFGGRHIGIPKPPGPAPKKTLIMDELLKGELTRVQMVRRFKVTERYVRIIASELRAIGCTVPTDPVGRIASPTQRADCE